MKKTFLAVMAVVTFGGASAQTRIGDVVWANGNVGERGTFVENHWDSGEFYTFEEAQTACPEGWRTPTVEELDGLMKQGTGWTTVKGVDGYVFGQGKNAVFLPAAGFRLPNGKVRSKGNGGYYWSTTGYGTGDLNGYYSRFNSSYAAAPENIDRRQGFSVRCVRAR